MELETLVVTIDQNDYSLIEKMNIQTNAIVGNQCNRTSVESIDYNGNKVNFYNTELRGVGRNRNLVLEKSKADICILADDDLCFVDGYPCIMEQAVNLAEDADIWIFNLIEENPRRYIIEKTFTVGYSNYARFGAARIAVRRKSIIDSNISFSLLFGGGACYSSGEDTLFLKQCLDKGLKIVAVPLSLASIDQNSESTWFSGYNQKFFYDKGALYFALYGSKAWMYCLRYLLKYHKKYSSQYSFFSARKQMKKGRSAFRKASNENRGNYDKK